MVAKKRRVRMNRYKKQNELEKLAKLIQNLIDLAKVKSPRCYETSIKQ